MNTVVPIDHADALAFAANAIQDGTRPNPPLALKVRAARDAYLKAILDALDAKKITAARVLPDNLLGPRPLTKRQAEIYRFIVEHKHEHGYAPSFDEIATRFGYHSLATVHAHLQSLQRKNWIRRRHNEARSIEICASPEGPSQ